MTTPHTPTRLTIRANGDANSYALLDDNGNWFMSLLVNGEQMEAKQEANLRRLAATWNACGDIPTEALEGSSVTALARDGGPVRQDDMRRINACVAICEGMDTDLLESILGVGETMLTKFKARDRVEQTIIADRLRFMQERDRLQALINTPQTDDYMTAVRLEAAHQVERWGAKHDTGKEPQDWFWLLGYLAGKALHAFTRGDQDKGLHHIISSAAALLNWHRHVTGENTAMRPGIDPVERGIAPPPVETTITTNSVCCKPGTTCNFVDAQPYGSKCTTCGVTVPF